VSGGQATASGMQSTTNLPNYVCWCNPLSIGWQVSFTAGASWVSAESSSNEAFITLDTPGNTWRTVLYLATKHGGPTVNNHDAALAAVWQSFANPTGVNDVGAWDDTSGSYTRWLHYYLTPSGGGVVYAKDLLLTGDGQCHAWADLLLLCFGAHIISDVGFQPVLVPPAGDTTVSPNEPLGGFGVKNVQYTGMVPPRYPSDPYVYIIVPDLTPQGPGIPGQGTLTPAANLFGNHWIVYQGYAGNKTWYYDPSYGVGAPNAANYTAGAIGAWVSATAGTWRPAPALPPPTLLLP